MFSCPDSMCDKLEKWRQERKQKLTTVGKPAVLANRGNMSSKERHPVVSYGKKETLKEIKGVGTFPSSQKRVVKSGANDVRFTR